MVLEAAHDGSFDVSGAAPLVAAEQLRREGNAAFQDKAFERALALYTEALAAHGADRHLLFSNRSATLLALKDFERALADAEKAVELAPAWPKGHVRKASACEALRRWSEASGAYAAAAALERATDAAQAAKLARKAEQLKARARQISSSGGVAVPRGFLASGKAAALYDEREDVTPEAPQERSWRLMLQRLKQGCNAAGVNASGERVVLDDGVFAKLLSERAFQQLVYPGIPPAQLAHAPRSLQALLADPWYERELLALMPKVEAKAERVLANVKQRGAAQGDAMDVATERQLRPQVLQEAFGREVLAMVHRVNYQKHAALAQDARTLADPSADAASWDQLPSAFLDALLLRERECAGAAVAGVAVLDAFMGDEWAELLLADARRMERNQLLLDTSARSAIDAQTLQRGAAPRASGRTRFLDESECQREHPALAELLEKLHALPFELNKKRPESVQLCAQFAHCTSLTHLRAGECQPLRLDCGAGDQDNGFKLTCVYFLNSLEHASASDGKREPGRLSLRASLALDGAEQSVEPVADRLVLFKSQRVYNEITALAAQQELFFVTFWIHGRELH
ncbi:hypothetical protein PybrP1_004576 [[Pythium] brassicae (nom. inval.)]|nr:hypothetical protein PybrP1_004576 [[Pythium] brassicae (nom. inval.)]